MLVLTRKKDERIKIGDHTVITVVEIKGDKVRLGFENQGDLIVRSELLEQGEATAVAGPG